MFKAETKACVSAPAPGLHTVYSTHLGIFCVFLGDFAVCMAPKNSEVLSSVPESKNRKFMVKEPSHTDSSSSITSIYILSSLIVSFILYFYQGYSGAEATFSPLSAHTAAQ